MKVFLEKCICEKVNFDLNRRYVCVVYNRLYNIFYDF